MPAAAPIVDSALGAALLCITGLARCWWASSPTPQPLGSLLLERLLQTLLGVAVGMLGAVLTRHVPAGTPTSP